MENGTHIYDFEVRREKLYRADGTDTNRDAIYRPDTGDQLGVVSREYQLVTHQAVVENTEKMIHNLDLPFKVKYATRNNGAVLKAYYRFPSERFDANGDTFDPTLLVGNGYNGYNAYTEEFGFFRYVCSNGAIVGTKDFSFTIKHRGHNIDLEELGEITMERIVATRDFMQIAYQRMISEYGLPILKRFLLENLIAEKYKVLLMEGLADNEVYVERLIEDDEAVDLIVNPHSTAFLTEYVVWNVLTAIATHKVKQLGAREQMDNTIARNFMRGQ